MRAGAARSAALAPGKSELLDFLSACGSLTGFLGARSCGLSRLLRGAGRLLCLHRCRLSIGSRLLRTLRRSQCLVRRRPCGVGGGLSPLDVLDGGATAQKERCADDEWSTNLQVPTHFSFSLPSYETRSDVV
jgi:hypothetical protein